MTCDEYTATLVMLGWKQDPEAASRWEGKDESGRDSYACVIDNRLVIQKRETVYLSFEQSLHLITTGTYLPYEDYNKQIEEWNNG